MQKPHVHIAVGTAWSSAGKSADISPAADDSSSMLATLSAGEKSVEGTPRVPATASPFPSTLASESLESLDTSSVRMDFDPTFTTREWLLGADTPSCDAAALLDVDALGADKVRLMDGATQSSSNDEEADPEADLEEEEEEVEVEEADAACRPAADEPLACESKPRRRCIS